MAKKFGTIDFISMAKQIHGDKYNYSVSNLVNFKTKIKIICNKCRKDFGLGKSFFFKRPTDHINGGQGCPKCSLWKSESIFGEALNSVFKKHVFKKERPPFLKIGNSRLELDYYCKNLEMAFEINGIQHYEYVEYFHKDIYGLLSLQGRDLIKDDLCREHGVELIKVDLRDFPVGQKRMRSFEDYLYEIKKEKGI